MRAGPAVTPPLGTHPRPIQRPVKRDGCPRWAVHGHHQDNCEFEGLATHACRTCGHTPAGYSSTTNANRPVNRDGCPRWAGNGPHPNSVPNIQKRSRGLRKKGPNSYQEYLASGPTSPSHTSKHDALGLCPRSPSSQCWSDSECSRGCEKKGPTCLTWVGSYS